MADAASCAALLLIAFWLRLDGWGASSLWLDDAWQALVARVHSLADMRHLEALAPGFSWTLRGWFALAGFSEGTAQGLPFVAGIALAPLGYCVAVRSGMSRTAALFAGLLLAAAPVHATFSSRLKPYAFDALAALGLVWAATEAMAARPRGRPAALAFGAAAAVVFSSATATIGASALAAVAFAHRRRPGRLVAVTAAAAFGLFAGAWWWIVLRPRASGDILLRYWSSRMIRGSNAGEWAASATDALTAMLEGMFAGPAQFWLIALALAAAVVALRCTERFVLFAAPLAAAVVLAALKIAPLGGGRTDIYLLVPTVFLVATAVDVLLRRMPQRGAAPARVAAAAAAGLCALASPGSRPYPAEDVRPLIEAVERERAPGEVVLVYALTRYAYGLYGRSDITLSRAPDGFAVHFSDPAIRVLQSHRRNPSLSGPEVRSATAGAPAVWLVVSHAWSDVQGIEQALEAAGYLRFEQREREGAFASYWLRLKS